MKSGAFEQLTGQLYAESFDLQVTPRRRKVKTSTVSVPAGGSASVSVSIPIDAADTLQANDGLLFDLIQASYQAAAAGVTIAQLAFIIQTPGGADFPIGQVVSTLSAVPTTLFTNSNLTPSPALLTSFDLGFVLNPPAPIGALLLTNQPLNLIVTAQFANSSAAAIVATLVAVMFYRIVRGLQEG